MHNNDDHHPYYHHTPHHHHHQSHFWMWLKGCFVNERCSSVASQCLRICEWPFTSQWHVKPSFSPVCLFSFCQRRYLVEWQNEDCWHLWLGHTTSNPSSGRVCFLFGMGRGCLSPNHLWCRLCRRCLGWFYSRSFLKLGYLIVILLLMLQICRRTLRLRKLMYARDFILTGCSCLFKWSLVWQQMTFFALLLKFGLFTSPF